MPRDMFELQVTGISTFMPLVFSGWDIDRNTFTLNNAGYPVEAQGGSTHDQWFGSDIGTGASECPAINALVASGALGWRT